MKRRSHGSKQLSQVKARTALAQLLNYCTPEQLASFTPAGLSRSYNIDELTAAAMLAEAKARRA